MKLDVLAIGAHRDDIELSCGGTIIKLVDQGYNVGILDLTRGEAGTRGSARQREKEANNAAKCMGIKVRENLGLPDAWVTNTKITKMKLIKILRKYQAETVIIPFWQDRHPDHYNTSILSYEACFLSGLEKIKIHGKAYRPKNIIYYLAFKGIDPSFIVDITDQFKRKIEAIKCYKSQFTDSIKGEKIFWSNKDIFEFQESHARICGALIGKKYGEAFLLKKPQEIENIMKIKGKFI
ncbi:MAG: bacillithiol biosynthesis deacetylase BshB1 [Candidatus Firestonebacteria bacterium]|nr:bacillithiol biosynthesis deacetylase BshB1 [Candidatus Firestonebacteria bacterium]